MVIQSSGEKSLIFESDSLKLKQKIRLLCLGSEHFENFTLNSFDDLSGPHLKEMTKNEFFLELEQNCKKSKHLNFSFFVHIFPTYTTPTCEKAYSTKRAYDTILNFTFE